MQAQKYFIGLRGLDNWIGNKFSTPYPTNDSRPAIHLCRVVLRDYWQGAGVFQVHVVALDPRPVKGQIDIFTEDDSVSYRRNKAMDLINERFGEFKVAPALLLNRSDMPNVIAPAWKPYGHRQTIPSTRPRTVKITNKKIYRLD